MLFYQLNPFLSDYSYNGGRMIDRDELLTKREIDLLKIPHAIRDKVFEEREVNSHYTIFINNKRVVNEKLFL